MSDTNTRGVQYSDEELLNELRKVHDRHGKVTIGLYNETEDAPASSVIIDRFGSWVEAKEQAGVGGDGRRTNSRPRKYSNVDMIEMLRECEQRHGRASQAKFDADDDFCSSGAVVKRFGTWSQAKREAGVE